MTIEFEVYTLRQKYDRLEKRVDALTRKLENKNAKNQHTKTKKPRFAVFETNDDYTPKPSNITNILKPKPPSASPKKPASPKKNLRFPGNFGLPRNTQNKTSPNKTSVRKGRFTVSSTTTTARRLFQNNSPKSKNSQKRIGRFVVNS